MSKKAEKVPLVEEAAGDILQTFETVSRDALARLNSDPVHGTDVLISVNALTSVRGLTAIDGLIQAERDSLIILSREPAIARVRLKDQYGVESTIFICRTTPASNSSTYASNRSALGRLAALPVGYRLPVGPRILTVLEKEKLRPTLKAELWESENTEFESLDFGVFTVEYLRPFLKSATLVQEATDFLSQLLADEQFKANIVEGKRRLAIQKMSLRDQPILDQYQDEIFRLPLRKQLFILGPAGTGKTTTLIRRLGQKLDTAYLEPEERDLIQAISASGGSSHRDSWLMFTPTELLKQYLKGQMRWKVFSGALNTKIMIGFMKRLVHGRPKRVFLILDNLRVHHSKAVKKWLAENEEKIRVFYLPSYSPELNPDELLNADLKQQVTKVAPPRNKIALTRTAIGALRSIQKQPGRVESYFGQKDVTYAA